MSKYYPQTQKTIESPRCPHNDGVICYPGERQCDRCGWDPEVGQARLEKFCKQHGIAVPLPRKEEE